MIFNNDSLSELRLSVKQRLSEKRYKHTLGVEKMARALGEVILPDKVGELCAAALLHDIAKEMTHEEHLELLADSGIALTEDDLETRPALHSFAAVPLIKTDYPEYAIENILSAVKNHTLGAPGMSIFDEIIFISDYAEEGRTYYFCIEVNKELLNGVNKENTFEDNVDLLHKASLKAINSTIASLSSRNDKINKRTFLTKKYLDDLICK